MSNTVKRVPHGDPDDSPPKPYTLLATWFRGTPAGDGGPAAPGSHCNDAPGCRTAPEGAAVLPPLRRPAAQLPRPAAPHRGLRCVRLVVPQGPETSASSRCCGVAVRRGPCQNFSLEGSCPRTEGPRLDEPGPRAQQACQFIATLALYIPNLEALLLCPLCGDPEGHPATPRVSVRTLLQRPASALAPR